VEILNYEFSFCLFAFCRRGYSSVQLQWFCLSGSNGRNVFVRRSVTCSYEGYCLSGKGSLIVEGRRHIVFQNVFGLKSRIFITAEFILRHESSSKTCLEGRTFIRDEGAKTRSRLRPQNIITPALPDGSTCPLILRGRFRWCNPIIENLRKK